MRINITYYNDEDKTALLLSGITEETLLKFFFKKCGCVNVSNLNYLLTKDGNTDRDIGLTILKLESEKFIKRIDSHNFKLTRKAYIKRLFDYRGWIFWTTIISLLILLLTLVLVLRA